MLRREVADQKSSLNIFFYSSLTNIRLKLLRYLIIIEKIKYLKTQFKYFCLATKENRPRTIDAALRFGEDLMKCTVD